MSKLSKMISVIVLLSVISGLSFVVSEMCIQNGLCSCQVSGGKVDLSALASPNPRFVDYPAQGNKDTTKYTYNPCVAIATGCGVSNTAAVCQTASPTEKYNNGKANSATFYGEPESSGFRIVYKNYDSNINKNRTSTVRLRCTKDEAVFVAFGETSSGSVNYEFELKSKHCCVVQVGLSTGSILLIIFFVLLIVYLVGGVLFLHFVRGAQGVEMIPNREFWKEIPFLIYDGCRFVMKGCKTDSTYSQI